ncbi:MAG TPA: TonB family protein [Candidatus Acidoferrales bacterium]|nr:TonB family protein [Candidatus Acidoferrales bacterium]
MGNESINKVSLPLSQLRILSSLLLLSLLILPLASWVLGDSSKDADARAQAVALFAKALAVSDLRAPGSPPFEMRGTITVEQENHKPAISGTYLLKWASPEKWREEIAFANYTHIRVGGENQYWQSRTTQYEIEPVLQLYGGLGFLKSLHVWARPAAIAALKEIKLHQKKEHGAKLDCVTLTQEGEKYGSDYCFDSVSGVLVNEFRGASEYSNFISFAGKHFPGSIRSNAEDAPAVTLTVNSILPLVLTDDGDFQPPQNSTVWPACDDPDNVPMLKSAVFPAYPAGAERARRQGTVTVYGVLGIDGRLSNLAALGAPDKSLAEAALAAMAKWKYTPETCRGTPVPDESLLMVRFDVQ